MNYEAISFIPQRLFRTEASENEFETDTYCLKLDGAISLHLKSGYLNDLLGDTSPDQLQIRKWHFYITHLNCLYLLLDSFVRQDLKYAYFYLEEITTQNADVVSENGARSISPGSHWQRSSILTDQKLLVPADILRQI